MDVLVLWPLIIWVVFAFVVGGVAGARGRSNFGWFLLAILLSPPIAGLILPDRRTRALLEDIRDLGSVDDRELERNVRRQRRRR